MNNAEKLSAWDFVKNSFQLLWNNKSTTAAAITIIAILQFFTQLFIAELQKSPFTVAHIISLICLIAFAYIIFALYLGCIKLTLSFIRNSETPVNTLFSCLNQTIIIMRSIGILALYILYFFGCFILLLLPIILIFNLEMPDFRTIIIPTTSLPAFVKSGILILPSMIVAYWFILRFSFCYFFIIDQNTPVIESLKMSFRITKNNLFIIIKTLILSFICMIVPMLVIILITINTKITIFLLFLNIFNVLLTVMIFCHLYLALTKQKSTALPKNP